jgi:probable HAF family extracellular repeat protein
MKTILISIAAGSLLAALATAQSQPSYTITDLGTLGGTYSYGYGINAAGQVAGGAATMSQTGGVYQTAFLWYQGSMTNIGTLGGLNSAASGPNASGEAAIGSETSMTDPNGEDFCEYGTHLQCLGAIWKNGVWTPLPTLGTGLNTEPFDLNNRDEVVGFAENGVHDATCLTGGTPFQVIRFEAVIWGPDRRIRELPPLTGDTVGFAIGTNDIGQVVGSSGLCSTTSIPPAPSGQHAVLWENDGTATDLGNLGGALNVAYAINNRGDVVGAALSPQDGTIHTFLWTQDTGMQDLGAFPGAVMTVPSCCKTINDAGQVIGWAMDAMGNFTALVWQNNKPVDLNTLIPPGSPWYLQNACSINDDGEIAGQGLINGEVHAFLATPRHVNAQGDTLAPLSQGASSPVALSEDARTLLRQRPLSGRPR